MVTWDLMGCPTSPGPSPNPSPVPDQGLVGCSMGFQGIMDLHIGRDRQEGSSMHARPGTGGRYQGLVGCPMGPQGTMGQCDVPKSQ